MYEFASQHRNTWIGKGLVLAGEFVALWLFIATFSALSWLLVDFLTYDWGLGTLAERLRVYTLLILTAAWLPSALLLAYRAWGGD